MHSRYIKIANVTLLFRGNRVRVKYNELYYEKFSYVSFIQHLPFNFVIYVTAQYVIYATWMKLFITQSYAILF